MLKRASVLILLIYSAGAHAAAWQEYARDLSIEEKRTQALSALKLERDLNSDLRLAFDNPQEIELASKVVQELKIKSLLPELSKKAGPRDREGRILLSVLRTDPEASESSTRELLKRLWASPKKLPEMQQLVLLKETPGSLDPLSDELFDHWAGSKNFELRKALADRLIEDLKAQHWKIERWKKLLATNPYQVRWQLIARTEGAASLPPKIKTLLLESCQKEAQSDVKALCAAEFPGASLRKGD